MADTLESHITALSKLSRLTDNDERGILERAEKRLELVEQKIAKLTPFISDKHGKTYRSLIAERDKLNRVIDMANLHIGEHNG